MPSLEFLRFMPLLSFLHLCISFTAAVDPTYRYHICSNAATFTRNSTYESNLNLLLSSLPSNACRSNGFASGFYNATAGQNPDKVCGLFLCRGDQTNRSCQDCVTVATTNVKQLCPVQKQSVIWYDECFLRYSNRTIFSTMDTSPRGSLWNPQNITANDRDRFNELVGNLMNETAAQAVSNANNFATRKAVFTTFQTLYGLAQCTPDLSSSNCNICLRVAIAQLPACCSGKQGGRVLFSSCNVRYEVYPFYIESSNAAPTPAPVLPSPPPPDSINGSNGKSGISSSTIIAIVAPIAVTTLLIIAGFCFRKKRAKKKYSAVSEEHADNDITTLQSLQFDFGTIEDATNRFSIDNKLGEGGFGEVYKGVLPHNGQEIAVKRLSKNSGQGAQEFKNEVVLVAKLQHRNLVRLKVTNSKMNLKQPNYGP